RYAPSRTAPVGTLDAVREEVVGVAVDRTDVRMIEQEAHALLEHRRQVIVVRLEDADELAPDPRNRLADLGDQPDVLVPFRDHPVQLALDRGQVRLDLVPR